ITHMPRVLTILEAHVPQARQADLQGAYRSAVHEAFPPGLVRSTLLQATNDRTLWRIETLWESLEVLQAMRGTGTPRGVQIFRAAGAEPTLTILDVLTSCRRLMALPNQRLKLSARWRRPCQNALWRPSFLRAAPAGRSLSATR